MTVPAFSVSLRTQGQMGARLKLVVACLAASMLGTLVAIVAALLAAWSRRSDLAFGLGLVASAALPALALILHGLDARGAARILVGALLAAPAIAVYYLFENPVLVVVDDPGVVVTDTMIAALFAIWAAAGAVSARQLERRAGLWCWWAAAVPAVAALWLVATHLRPAQVWIEMPRL